MLLNLAKKWASQVSSHFPPSSKSNRYNNWLRMKKMQLKFKSIFRWNRMYSMEGTSESRLEHLSGGRSQRPLMKRLKGTWQIIKPYWRKENEELSLGHWEIKLIMQVFKKCAHVLFTPASQSNTTAKMIRKVFVLSVLFTMLDMISYLLMRMPARKLNRI